jgi:hypothetical protein
MNRTSIPHSQRSGIDHYWSVCVHLEHRARRTGRAGHGVRRRRPRPRRASDSRPRRAHEQRGRCGPGSRGGSRLDDRSGHRCRRRAPRGRRPPHLRRGGILRADRGARCGGVRDDLLGRGGTGDGSTGRRGPGLCGRAGSRRGRPRRGRSSRERGGGVGRGRGRRCQRERPHAVRAGRRRSGRSRGRADRVPGVRRAVRACASGRPRDRGRSRSGGPRRFDAAESGHGAEARPQHDLHDLDDPAREDLRESHGRRRGDEREAPRAGPADRGGGGGRRSHHDPTAPSHNEFELPLEAADGDAKVAIVSLLAGVDAADARTRLAASDGNIRPALDR